jgi:glutamate dehydrogenase (NADP+)
MLALAEYLKLAKIDPSGLTVAVQGVGNVGFFFATHAEKDLGIRIVAVGDSKRTLMVKNFRDNQTYLSLEGFTESRRGMISELDDQTNTEFIERDRILELDVDILVLAALGDSITEKNVGQVKAPIILELANGPIDDFAFKKLKDRAAIIPDVIANSGGVIVSYLEWVQNKKGEKWSLEKVDKKLDSYMETALRGAYEYSTKHNTPLKEAALSLAIKRLLAARKT